MKNKFDQISKSRIDIHYLKDKGLSDLKISKMTGIPLKQIKEFLKYNDTWNRYSGVY